MEYYFEFVRTSSTFGCGPILMRSCHEFEFSCAAKIKRIAVAAAAIEYAAMQHSHARIQIHRDKIT